MKKTIISLFLVTTFSSQAHSTDLLDAYWQAVKNDPTFRAAHSELKSNQESIRQAKAGLWPIITTATSKSIYNNATNQILDTTGPTPISTSRTARNKPRTLNVTVTQPIITFETYARIRQANATVAKAISDFQAAEQNLMLRVANAYLDVLEAQDTLTFTRAEKKSIARQLDQAKQRYKVGLDAITSVYDAQASYDAVISREITAQNDLRNRLESLGEITGHTYQKLVTVREKLPLQRPEPDNVDVWVKSALRSNKTLLSARADVEISKQQVSVARGAMIPTLNVVASYDNNTSNNFGFGSTSFRSKQVGLSLDVPVFQGGRLLSEANQAKYNLATTLARLDAQVKTTVSQTRQAYNSLLSGIGAVQADRQAVKSSQSSLDSTEAAFKVGTRTMVDVLDKQRDLYDVKRRLASDTYNFIKEVLRLKLASGVLHVVDLEEINSWLRGPTAHTTIERFNPNKRRQILGPITAKPKPMILAERQFIRDFRALGVKRPYLLQVTEIDVPKKIQHPQANLATTSQLKLASGIQTTYDVIDQAQHPKPKQARLSKQVSAPKQTQQPHVIAKTRPTAQQRMAHKIKTTPSTIAKTPTELKVERRQMRDNLALYIIDKQLANYHLLQPKSLSRTQRQQRIAMLKSMMKAAQQEAKAKQFTVALGSYQEKRNASQLSKTIKAITGKQPTMHKITRNHKTLYQVNIGPLKSIAQAEQIALDLHNSGINTAVVKTS